jgi:drug/metabolite transporter (DMT)-like permease
MAGLSYRSGVFLVLLAGATWSTTGLMIRLIHEAHVWQILFYRSVAMTPVLFLFIAYRSKNRLLDILQKAGIAAAIGAIGLVIAFAFFTALLMCKLLNQSIIISPWDTGVSMFMGVFQLGFGLSIYTFGSKVVPAVELALMSMTEVLLGPIWVWIFIGELAGLWTFVGGAILLASITGNALTGIRRTPPKIM